MPTREQMEKLARDQDRLAAIEPAPDEPPPAEWWDSVLSDPRAAGKPWLPIQQRRLSEIPRHLLRVERLRCNRIFGPKVGPKQPVQDKTRHVRSRGREVLRPRNMGRIALTDTRQHRPPASFKIGAYAAASLGGSTSVAWI